jgi:hypothetical protein
MPSSTRLSASVEPGARSVTAPELFTAANDSAWGAGLKLSQADVWIAVYDWGGFDYDNPPPDHTAMSLRRKR